MLGPGGVDSNAKPIFIATSPSRFVATEKESLTDQEKVALKTFQLHRRILSMTRRDQVYQNVTSGDFTTGKVAQNMMGTPYPVVKPAPNVTDTLRSQRWYEYAAEVTFPLIYVRYALSKPMVRSMRQQHGLFIVIYAMLFCASLSVGTFRAYFRLIGTAPNEPECLKYGVTESKARLEQKKKLWEQYAHYRMEWMRRFDYHVYGIRPGETFSLFSPCLFPPTPPRYATRTDYPLRDHITLRGHMKDYNLESRSTLDFVFHPAQKDMQERPELMHIRDSGLYPDMDKVARRVKIEDRQ